MLLKTVLALLLLIVAVSSIAIIKNGVPIIAPPGPVERLLTYLSKNTAATRADHGWPELRTRAYRLPADELLGRVASAAGDLGWKIEKRDTATGELHAVVSTPWLGFKDDVRAVVEPSDNLTRLQVTSRSRIGRADYGANAGHIIALYEALERSL
jgi:hypothetical protein